MGGPKACTQPPATESSTCQPMTDRTGRAVTRCRRYGPTAAGVLWNQRIPQKAVIGPTRRPSSSYRNLRLFGRCSASSKTVCHRTPDVAYETCYKSGIRGSTLSFRVVTPAFFHSFLVTQPCGVRQLLFFFRHASTFPWSISSCSKFTKANAAPCLHDRW